MKIRRLICAALAASLALCPAAFAADTPKTDRIVTTQNGTGYSVSSVGRHIIPVSDSSQSFDFSPLDGYDLSTLIISDGKYTDRANVVHLDGDLKLNGVTYPVHYQSKTDAAGESVIRATVDIPAASDDVTLSAEAVSTAFAVTATSQTGATVSATTTKLNKGDPYSMTATPDRLYAIMRADLTIGSNKSTVQLSKGCDVTERGFRFRVDADGVLTVYSGGVTSAATIELKTAERQPDSDEVLVTVRTGRGISSEISRDIVKKGSNYTVSFSARRGYTVDALTLSADGSKVIYQSTLETDAVDKTGKVQFPKGRYTVTIDVAKGEQTYTRADLPETTEGTAPDGSKFTVSAEAKQDVESALALGLTGDAFDKNYRKPVQRAKFGRNALEIAGLAFGENVTQYSMYQSIQDKIANKEPSDLTVALGIYSYPAGMDSENYYAYATGEITRQEAAGMMARAYRLYSGEVHDDMEPLAYTDKADIADESTADVQLMTHLGVMTDVGDGRFDPEGPYSVEDSLVGLYRLYQNTCVGKKPDQPDIFALTPRQKQIAQAYSSGPYITSAENDATFTIAYHGDTGYMAPTSVYIWVVDRNGTCHRYQNIIKKSSNAYRGTGEAGIDKIWLAEDGSKVYFQSTLKDDVYFYDNNGNRGKLLFAKGVYTVTLDVATGKQTYTRADLT